MADQPTKQFFFLYVPYLPEKVFTVERIADFKEHVDRVSGLRKSGFIRAGHTITDRESLDLPLEKKVFTGSVVIFESETIEEVQKFIETDMFYTDDIWDKEKIILLPFGFDPFIKE